MPIKKNERLQALVVKSSPHGESNKIVSLFLSDGRYINGMAHGARKPASRFGAALEPATLSQVELRYGKRPDDLVTVADGRILNAHTVLKTNLFTMGVLFDFLGLLQYVCQVAGGDEILFRRSVTLLRHCVKNPGEIAGMMPVARLSALLHFGRMPDWSSCTVCHSVECRRVSLHGVYCESCAAKAGEETRPVSAGVLILADIVLRTGIPVGQLPWSELDGILEWMLEAAHPASEMKRGKTHYVRD
ncbi:MAG TPA: DNA repair protein RecO [Spirochaetota bacterium]|nr:DNA repair protein RecO [Spirochaetota bacterium]HPH02493.1 DNA repair protein RecO [Spirochaetota bacterium]